MNQLYSCSCHGNTLFSTNLYSSLIPLRGWKEDVKAKENDTSKVKGGKKENKKRQDDSCILCDAFYPQKNKVTVGLWAWWFNIADA